MMKAVKEKNLDIKHFENKIKELEKNLKLISVKYYNLEKIVQKLIKSSKNLHENVLVVKDNINNLANSRKYL